MQYLHRYTLFLSVILLIGCTKQIDSTKNLTTISAKESNLDLGVPVTNAGVVFVMTPSVIDNCDSLNHTIDVDWDVNALGVKSVTIYADDGESEQKVWVKGGASGHEKTGNWIKNNSTLRLTDSVTGKVLALHQFHEIDCKAKK